MIMPLTEKEPSRFGWDETPREVFRGSRHHGIVAHIRRSERELAAFLREWRGFDFSESRADGELCQ